MRRQFKMMAPEMGMTMGELLEVVVTAYKISPSTFRYEFR